MGREEIWNLSSSFQIDIERVSAGSCSKEVSIKGLHFIPKSCLEQLIAEKILVNASVLKAQISAEYAVKRYTLFRAYKLPVSTPE